MKRPWLAPLAPLYAAAWSLRTWALYAGWAKRRRLNWPVVSVGSISTGGAGKTPLTIALARLMTADGIAVDVLSRGYGRKTGQALAVDPDGDVGGDAETFGDEPLLIARQARVPVYVAGQRWEAGRIAETRPTAGCAAHLLDDGFQHWQLERALDIAMVGVEDLGDHLLPAGNLREPLRALQRADVLAVREDDAAAREWFSQQKTQQPVWLYRRTMHWPAEMPESVFAFCGIARPEAFLQGLRAGGVRLAGERILRDHQPYGEQEMARLRRELEQCGARAFVTTAKDLARMGSRVVKLQQAAPVFCADVEVSFMDPEAVMERIRKACREQDRRA